MSLAAMLLPEFDQEMANTRIVLARCPEEKFGYTPHVKSFTMGSLATHMVNMIGWTVDTIKTDEFDIAPVGQPPYKEDAFTSSAKMLEKFDANVAAARAAIAGASDESYGKQWSLLAGGKAIFSMPRGAVIRGMIMNHIIHHRAQLALYLRLNDLPVPALYGPSADEGNM